MSADTPSSATSASAMPKERGNASHTHTHHADTAGDSSSLTATIKEKKLTPVGKKGVRFPAFDQTDFPLKPEAGSAKEQVEFQLKAHEHLSVKEQEKSESASKTSNASAASLSLGAVNASNAHVPLKSGTRTTSSLFLTNLTQSTKKIPSGPKGASTDSHDTVFLGLAVHCALATGPYHGASHVPDDDACQGESDGTQGSRTGDISPIRLQPFKVTVHDLRLYVRVGECL